VEQIDCVNLSKWTTFLPRNETWCAFEKNAPWTRSHVCVVVFVPELCAFVEYIGIISHSESISISISNHSQEREKSFRFAQTRISQHDQAFACDLLFMTLYFRQHLKQSFTIWGMMGNKTPQPGENKSGRQGKETRVVKQIMKVWYGAVSLWLVRRRAHTRPVSRTRGKHIARIADTAFGPEPTRTHNGRKMAFLQI
jgi:hypothetical protein